MISGHERLVLGKDATLSCKVLDVYPGQETELEWRDESGVLETHRGTESMRTLELNVTVTPTREGRNITCRALHHMRGVPAERSSIQTTVTLSVPCESTFLMSSKSHSLKALPASDSSLTEESTGLTCRLSAVILAYCGLHRICFS